jgi:hypothetical protein
VLLLLLLMMMMMMMMMASSHMPLQAAESCEESVLLL